MNIAAVNLRMLSYLVALADTRHFGKAAEQVFVSQPTLSAQLKKLEVQLGVPLIERHPGNIMLTEVGEKIVVRARQMLATAEEIGQLAESFTDPLAGSLRIGLIPTLGPYLLPHIVRHVRNELPALNCRYLEYQTDPLLERLNDGRLDVGILALPVETEGLETQALFDEPFRLAVNTSHALAGRKRVKLADLDGCSFLLLEDGHCLRDQALEVCTLAGVSENSDFRATSLETLRQMVAADAGMTLLPALAADLGANGDVATVGFAKPVPSRTIAAIWRSSSVRAEAVESFSAVVAKHAPRDSI